MFTFKRKLEMPSPATALPGRPIASCRPSSRRRRTSRTRKARTSRATSMGRRRPSLHVLRRCLATSETNRADLPVAFRWADHDLDITTQPQQNADEPVGREAAQFAVEQKGNLRPGFSCLVGDLNLRHVALVDDALNLRQQIFLLDEWVTNPRLRAAAPAFCCAHPDPVCGW